MSIPTFIGGYNPPDVYVADVTTPLITSTGVPPQVLTLIGPALGFRTASQSFLIFAATGFQLSFTGVFDTSVAGPPAIGAPVVTLSDGTVLTVGTDYALTVTPDPSGDPSLAVTTVNRSGTSVNVSDGDQVTIVYNYADVTYYQPQVFTDYQSVLNAYGPPMVSTAPSTPNASQVANPLSFAVQVAFANNANTIIAVALNPADGDLEQQFQSAYAKVANTYAATILVPVFTDDLVTGGPTVAAYAELLANDLLTACVNASNAGFPRIGIFGLPRNYSESDISPTSFATFLSNKRAVLMYPEIVQVFNGLTNQVFNAAACYFAVAAGAILSALPVDTGLTRQQLAGFSGLTQTELQTMTPGFMNTLASAGICIVNQNRNNNLVIRHGLTTDMTGLNTREISLVRQADTLLTTVQAGLENANLIGQPITAEMPATVQGALVSILEQDVASGVIQSYANLTVTQQAYPGGDPSVMVCSFTYAPAIPLNYIEVTFSINLTTGQVTTQSAQNTAASSTSAS